MADMARAHINFRTWAALALLGPMVVLFAWLGNWQLDRASQRDAIHAQIQHAALLPPLNLNDHTAESELIPWRPAQTQGHWLHQYTVLLQNRNYHARPGYWVATPLQLHSSPPSGDPASSADSFDTNTTPQNPSADTSANGSVVLILRGWLARDDVIRQGDSGAATLAPDLGQRLAQPDGDQVVTVSGELLSHVPRLFELWSWSDTDGAQLPGRLNDALHQRPALQNLDLDEYKQTTGLPLMPVVLAASDSTPPMVQDWPQPSADSDTNRGYALQWFSFCVIAAGAWLLIAWRVARKVFN